MTCSPSKVTILLGKLDYSAVVELENTLDKNTGVQFINLSSGVFTDSVVFDGQIVCCV